METQIKKSKVERWKQGMQNLTPLQLLNAKITSYAGSAVGILFAWYFILLRGLWFFSIILFFGFSLQIISLIQAWQQKQQMLKAEEMMSSQNKNLQKIMKEMEDENGKTK